MDYSFVIEFSEHEFYVKEVKIKTGKNVGQKKFTVKLIIPPFTFRKKTSTNTIESKVIFVCNGCEKKKCSSSSPRNFE